jgi:hypothetical protein
MDRDGSIKLLSVILADQPRLPGAACRDRRRLFDVIPGNGGRVHRHQEQQREARAAACCGGCPARAKCPTVVTLPHASTTHRSGTGLARPA